MRLTSSCARVVALLLPAVLLASPAHGGGRAETWHPHFGYHGFRYLDVRGLPAAAGGWPASSRPPARPATASC